MPYFFAKEISTVQSTLANLIGEPSFAKILAALAYSGAKAWQSEHQGA